MTHVNIDTTRLGAFVIAIVFALVFVTTLMLPVHAAEATPFESLPDGITDKDTYFVYYNKSTNQYNLIYCSAGFKNDSIPLTYNESSGSYTFSVLPADKYSYYIAGQDGSWSMASRNQFTSTGISVTVSEIEDVGHYPGQFTLDGKVVYPSPFIVKFMECVKMIVASLFGVASVVMAFVWNEPLALIPAILCVFVLGIVVWRKLAGGVIS
jgi:hypothetical protein